MNAPENLPLGRNAEVIGQRELTEIVVSPTIWYGAQSAVRGYEAGDTITPEGYQTLLAEKGVKHANGDPLTDDELLATFEALQEGNILSKNTLDETLDTYSISKPPAAPDKPKPHVGYGSAASPHRTVRHWKSGRDKVNATAEIYADDAGRIGKAVGSTALKMTRFAFTGTTKPAPKPPTYAEISKEAKEAKDDAFFTANRHTRLQMGGYEQEEIDRETKARQKRMMDSMGGMGRGMRGGEGMDPSTMQGIASIVLAVMDERDNRSAANGDRKKPSKRESDPAKVRARREQQERDAELLKRVSEDPKYERLFDDKELADMHSEVQVEAKPEFNAKLKALNEERAKHGYPAHEKLPKGYSSDISAPIGDRLAQKHAEKHGVDAADITPEVVKAITIKRLMVRGKYQEKSRKK